MRKARWSSPARISSATGPPDQQRPGAWRRSWDYGPGWCPRRKEGRSLPPQRAPVPSAHSSSSPGSPAPEGGAASPSSRPPRVGRPRTRPASSAPHRRPRHSRAKTPGQRPPATTSGLRRRRAGRGRQAGGWRSPSSEGSVSRFLRVQFGQLASKRLQRPPDIHRRRGDGRCPPASTS